MKLKVMAVLILALFIWMLFYNMGAPLNAEESAVVVGLTGLLFWAVNWLWQRFWGRRTRGVRGNGHDSS